LGGHDRRRQHAVGDEQVRLRLRDHLAHVAGDLDAAQRSEDLRSLSLEGNGGVRLRRVPIGDRLETLASCRLGRAARREDVHAMIRSSQ
jgi:hypothetical protein